MKIGLRYGLYLGLPFALLNGLIDLLYRVGILGGRHGASNEQTALVGAVSIGAWLLATFVAGALAARQQQGSQGSAGWAGFFVVAVDQARSLAVLLWLGVTPGPDLVGPGVPPPALPATPGLLVLGTLLIVAVIGTLGGLMGRLGGRMLGSRLAGRRVRA